ncbi:hypothetical protein [Roseimaritima multifibrata]|nr:hypothetical protein [Roseimaritima multifibrata]
MSANARKPDHEDFADFFDKRGGEHLMPLLGLCTLTHMVARMLLLICTLMLCPSLAKAGIMIRLQPGPSISQASEAMSIPVVVPHGDREHREHIHHAIPTEGLAAFPSPSIGSVVSFAALVGVATPLPIAELRWRLAISVTRLAQTPHYRSLLKPS